MNFPEFLERYKDALARCVVETYPPRYDATVREACGFDLRRLLRRPLGAQADAIRATVLALHHGRSAHIVAEMGCGKSFIAAATASFAGCRRVLVICPPHVRRVGVI